MWHRGNNRCSTQDQKHTAVAADSLPTSCAGKSVLFRYSKPGGAAAATATIASTALVISTRSVTHLSSRAGPALIIN